ncbi:MAG: 50S ribosomal protein L10 [Thermoproteota archaeon]|nr:50S ribosomal protein L10 [Thermoproteota archaeon]
MSANGNRTNRTHYPRRKQNLYLQMQELPKAYSVIALSSMSKVRAAQLMKIRKKFHNDIKIKIIKNRVVQKSFEKINGIVGLDQLSSKLEGQCALMFTNISPFKLNLVFDQNKVYLHAKGGDVTKRDIMIPSGNTGISPGPVLSEFKEVNVPTKIDQGTIWVSKDTRVAKVGDVITQKTAALLSKLNIKPIEAGIAVNFAISDGLVFEENDLKIDLKEYANELITSHCQALSLAVELAYTTSETIRPLLIKANRFAELLASTSGYISPSTVKLVLARAQSNAGIIAKTIKNKGYMAN